MSHPSASRLFKLLRWFTWRRCVKLLAGLLLLLVATYNFENWRGRRAMDAQVARYAAAGISLQLQDYVPPRVAPEDNFCATPLLDGIALSNSDDTVQGWEAAMVKRERLNFKIRYPYDDEDFMAAKKQVPWGEILKSLAEQRIPNGTPRTRPKGAPPYLPRWNVTADAPASAASVYTALDAEKAVFDELVATSRRPKAVFTPQPCDYFPFWEEREIYYGQRKLNSLIRLRLAVAAETERFAEAEDLVRVLWRLREALAAEPAGGAYVWSVVDLQTWIGAVQDVLASHPPAEVIRRLIEQPLRWDAEQEYRWCRKGLAACSFHLWQTLADDAAWTFRGDLHGVFRARGFVKVDYTQQMLRIPSGWLRQNGATKLRRDLDYCLLPFSTGGFPALPAGEAAYKAEVAQVTLADRFFLLYFGDPEEKYICQQVQFTRLTTLALAMELHRAAKGRYPDTLAALVPEFIPAIPGDLDGAPLRAVVTPDGQKAVVYSVGWNQKDDWHGIPPEKPGRATEALDWILRLPVVRSGPAPVANKPGVRR